MLKNLATGFEKMKTSSARAVVMEKERDAVTAKYEELHSSVQKRVGITHIEVARLKAKIVMRTQERESIVAKAEQFSPKVQCATGSADEAKKLRERMSSLETGRCVTVLKGEKRPAIGRSIRRLMLKPKWSKIVWD